MLHDGSMDNPTESMTQTEGERSALEAICRRRKVDALVWKRARAFLLLDAGYYANTICEILDIGPTVLTQWRFSFASMGLPFFGLKDYSQRQDYSLWSKSGPHKHISRNIQRATQMRFAPIFWLSTAKAIAHLERQS